MIVDLNKMYATPGIWVVAGTMSMAVVEVDAAGLCYQLKPGTFERDGELPRAGWNQAANTLLCVGPLARPAA